MPTTQWWPARGSRRAVVAFFVFLLCTAAVFALPSLIFNSVSVALTQAQQPAPPPTEPPPATPPAQPPAPSSAPEQPEVKPQEPAIPPPPPVDPLPAVGPATPAPPVSLWTRLSGLLGVVVIIGIGVAFSRNRRAIRWSIVAWGLGLQFLFAVFVLRVPWGQRIFEKLGAFITQVLSYSYFGSEFVFGQLGTPVATQTIPKIGVVFAFQILPAIIFVSALFAILYYLGVMQIVVRGFAVAMSRLMGASGAESLNTAAAIFMGQTEAPLTVRPFLPRMTQSELMTVMVGGFATISGSIMAAYIAFGIEARHLLAASIMVAPAAIMMAKLFEPETGQPETMGNVDLNIPKTDVNIVDAASRGTSEGLHLMLNVIAMLVSFVALVALINGGLGLINSYLPWFPANMQTIFGWAFRPIAWVMGVPWAESGVIGSLLGTRMVLNEFIAYAQLGELKETISPRSFTIASYALCGFANFASVGIQIGGIGALAPERKHDLARLGFRAMLAATLANFLTATLAGFLL